MTDNWEPLPEKLRHPLLGTNPFSEWVGAWVNRHRQLTVIVTRDAGRWHLSIAHPTRYPSWEEIKRARYRFVPDDVYMMMGLPPKHLWVNVHQNCFHLWEAEELKTKWIME